MDATEAEEFKFDLILTLQRGTTASLEEKKTTAKWLVDKIKDLEPLLHIRVKYHQLNDCYALYFWADIDTLLKAAEVFRLKKDLKEIHGGGKRVFHYKDKRFFGDKAEEATFLSQIERSSITRQMLELIRATKEDLVLPLSSQNIPIPAGRALVSTLEAEEVITSLYFLHDENIVAPLRRSLVFTFWRDQPLEDIRSYFGSEIALYFAWLDYLTKALCFPALLGVIIYVLGGWPTGDPQSSKSSTFTDVCFVVFALFICIWSSIYLEQWKRRQAVLSFKWGTYLSHPEAERLLRDPQPDFKGESIEANPATGRLEPFCPDWKKWVKRFCVGYPCTVICAVILFLVLLITFKVEDAMGAYCEESFFTSYILCYLPMIVFAVFSQYSENLYRDLAFKLNDFENYRSEEDFEKFLITKIVLFQFVFAFGTLIYTTFVLQDIRKLQEILTALLSVRIIPQIITKTAFPFVLDHVTLMWKAYENAQKEREDEERIGKPRSSSFARAGSFNEYDDNTPQSRKESEDRHKKIEELHALEIIEYVPAKKGSYEITAAEHESELPAYDRTMDDYLELFIQFGFVLLFSPIYPLAAAFALISNVLEERGDAFKLCNTVQRPFGREARDIGAWQKAIEVIGTLGVIVNCALIAQSGLVRRMWPDLPPGGQLLIVVILEHLIFGVKKLIDLAIPDVPKSITIELAKQEHHRRESFRRSERSKERQEQDFHIVETNDVA